jgi:integration host factor subunit alpha
MTKKDIVQKVQGKVGLPASTVAALVDEMLEIMKERLAAGEDVKISRFGRFSVQHRTPRRGRNPHTGDDLVIPERTVLTFKPSKILKERI